MPVYCRYESGVEVNRLLALILEFMESARALHRTDPRFLSTVDLVVIGNAFDSVNGVLCRLATTRFDYYTYLLSSEWAAKREATIRKAGGRCQVCNSKNKLNCHHRTYERIGHELPEDLSVLCEECHKLFHENGKLARPS